MTSPGIPAVPVHLGSKRANSPFEGNSLSFRLSSAASVCVAGFSQSLLFDNNATETNLDPIPLDARQCGRRILPFQVQFRAPG